MAATRHSDLLFAAADAGALPIRSGALSGIVAWYSLIHLPTQRLAGVFNEFARATRPGALVVVDFRAATENAWTGRRRRRWMPTVAAPSSSACFVALIDIDM